MTQQYESLINPNQFNKNLLSQFLQDKNRADIFMVFDAKTDTLMFSFKDPKSIDTATYNISERLACVLDIDNLQIVGFWLMRFSSYWLELEESKEIKEIWNEIVKKGYLSKYLLIQKANESNLERKKYHHNSKYNKTEIFINQIRKSNELIEELCYA